MIIRVDHTTKLSCFEQFGILKEWDGKGHALSLLGFISESPGGLLSSQGGREIVHVLSTKLVWPARVEVTKNGTREGQYVCPPLMRKDGNKLTWKLGTIRSHMRRE